MNKKMLLIPAAATALLFTTAGSCDGAHSSGPEPTTAQITQLDKLQVAQMPDGFRNFTMGCIKGTKTMVLVTSRGFGTAYDGSPIPSSIATTENAQYCGGTIAVPTN